MIHVFEEKFRELVPLLPDLSDGSKVRYEWGTIDVLNKYLTIIDNKSKYPLIWLVTGKSDGFTQKQKIERKCRFIIATKSTDPNELNFFQYQKDFKDNLYVILDWFISLLQKSGITIIDDNEYSHEMMPNFSIQTKDNGILDIWNAINFECDITMLTDRCVNNEIKF